MPDTTEVYDWALQREKELLLFRFDQTNGRLQRNGEVEYLDTPTSLVLGVLLRHADLPVTSDDFLEAGMQTKGGGTLRKSIKELKHNELVSSNILQIGENKRAIYSFLTNPDDADLLSQRMADMYQELHHETESDTAKRHSEIMRKLGITAAALATSAAGYIVVKQIKKRR